jgi:surface antigen
MASRKIGRLLLVTGTLSICSYLLLARNTQTLPSIALTNPITRSIGDKVDSFNNVYVYYNGSIGHVLERHISKDGYNLGLKYQCVEFVKRYYYQYYKHKMPDSYGHAKDFFNKNLSDGAFNKGRNLRQFSNPSSTKPKIGDILVFDGHEFNPYGHVAIVTAVSNETIEIIQQNPGPTAPSRETLSIYQSGNQFEIEDGLGWLGKR